MNEFPNPLCGSREGSILASGMHIPNLLKTIQRNHAKGAQILLQNIPNFRCIVIILLEDKSHFPNVNITLNE